jgi:hypothetical protein
MYCTTCLYLVINRRSAFYCSLFDRKADEKGGEEVLGHLSVV